MTSSACYTVSVWCCLLLLQHTSVLRIVYADDYKRTIVNYGQMNSEETITKSVLMDGNEVHLAEWLSDVSRGEDSFRGNFFTSNSIRSLYPRRSNKYPKELVMYKFVKCECAYYVMTLVRSIYLSWTSLSAADKRLYSTKSNRSLIGPLKRLSGLIKKALTELFEIGDEYPHVKSSEPYFVKTLFITSFYVDGNHLFDLKPQNVDRDLLQILNLVRHYAIEHCDYGRNDNGVDTVQSVDEQLWDKFDRFLDRIAYTWKVGCNGPVQVKYQPTDLYGIKLEYCMHGAAARKLFYFCHIMRNVRVTRPDGTKKFILTLEYDVDRLGLNAVESVYEYILTVYKFVLKCMYQLTVWLWEGANVKMKDVDKFRELISKLRSTRFSKEIVDHLEFVMRIESHRNDAKFHLLRDAAKQLAQTKADGIQTVTLTKMNTLNDMGLFSFVYAITHHELRQFWWAFDILDREEAKKFRGVYDHVSLRMFAEASEKETQVRCDVLNEAYRVCSNLESAINECLSSSDDAKEHDSRVTVCVSKIREPGFVELSNYLLRKAVEWKPDDGVQDDLVEIFLSATIGLKNELNIKVDDSESITRKLRKWKRMLKGTMSVLDNYAIRKCPVLNDRETELEKKGEISSTAITDISTIYESEIFPKHFYRLELMTGMDTVKNSNTLGTEISFDWQGGIKSFREIHRGVLENSLNPHDLVDFQLIYLKWVIYLFYKTWLMVSKDHLIQSSDNFVKAYECLDGFNAIGVPERCREYSDFSKSNLNLFKIINEPGDVINNILSSMAERLGVVKDNSIDIADVQNFFDIKAENWLEIEVYSILRSAVQNKLKTIKETFRFII